MVVGDFVAEGTAEGLEEAFADVENVVIRSKTNGSSGLVRDDYYDWASEIGPILEAEKPALVVIQLGSNDRQVMRVDGSTQDVRSEPWTEEYKQRIDELLDAVSSASVSVVWVGTPPFRFKSMSADMLAFNGLYQTAVEARRGYFVDIWDGFVDEEGRFIQSGPDIKGQTVRLRNSDGINFTRAGKRKSAFYVERQLKLILGDDVAPLLTSLAPEGLPMLKLPPLQTESELIRTNPISMTDPDLDGGGALLGDMTDAIAGTEVANANPLVARSVRQRLIEDGSAPPTQPGRAGNFVRRAPQNTVSAEAPEILTLPPTPPNF